MFFLFCWLSEVYSKSQSKCTLILFSLAVVAIVARGAWWWEIVLRPSTRLIPSRIGALKGSFGQGRCVDTTSNHYLAVVSYREDHEGEGCRHCSLHWCLYSYIFRFTYIYINKTQLDHLARKSSNPTSSFGTQKTVLDRCQQIYSPNVLTTVQDSGSTCGCKHSTFFCTWVYFLKSSFFLACFFLSSKKESSREGRLVGASTITLNL